MFIGKATKKIPRWRDLPAALLQEVLGFLKPEEVTGSARSVNKTWSLTPAAWPRVDITGHLGIYAGCNPVRVRCLHLDDRWPDIKLEHFRNLRDLTLLHGCAHLQAGAILSHLERLTLQGADTIPAAIANLPGLRELVVNGGLANTSLRSIGLVTQLHSLEISLNLEVDATDHGFAHLAALTNLTTLRVKSRELFVSPAVLGRILSSIGPNLRALELSRLISEQCSAHIVRNCPQLEDLTLAPSPMTSTRHRLDLRFLVDLTRLVKLSVAGDFGLYDLGPLNAPLRALTLRNLSLDDLAFVGALQELEDLSLELQSGVDTWPLANLRRLRVFHLQSRGLSDTHFDVVAHLPSLRELRLSRASSVAGTMTDAGLVHLCALHQLQKLTLRNFSEFTDRGLAHLARLCELQFLSLHPCSEITLSALRTVSWPSLKRLELFFLGAKRRARARRLFAHAAVVCFPE